MDRAVLYWNIYPVQLSTVLPTFLTDISVGFLSISSPYLGLYAKMDNKSLPSVSVTTHTHDYFPISFAATAFVKLPYRQPQASIKGITECLNTVCGVTQCSVCPVHHRLLYVQSKLCIKLLTICEHEQQSRRTN